MNSQAEQVPQGTNLPSHTSTEEIGPGKLFRPRTGMPTYQSHQEWSQGKREIKKWQEIHPTRRAKHQNPEHQNSEETSNIKGRGKRKQPPLKGKSRRIQQRRKHQTRHLELRNPRKQKLLEEKQAIEQISRFKEQLFRIYDFLTDAS